VQSKGLKIRNAQKLGETRNKEDRFADSDEELDPYAEKLKKDAKQRATDVSDSEDDDYDPEKDIKKRKTEKESSDEEESNSEPSAEDSELASDGDSD